MRGDRPRRSAGAGSPSGGWPRRRQPRRGDDRGRPVRCRRLRLPPHAAGAIGIPAVVPRRDVPLVGDVDQHPRQELERVHGLGARRRAVGLVRPIDHDLGGTVVREPLSCDGIPCTVPGEPSGEGLVLLGHPDGRVHVESGVRPSQHARGLKPRATYLVHGGADEWPMPGGITAISVNGLMEILWTT